MDESNTTEQAILAQVKKNQETLANIHSSVEKTRKLFLWTLIITIAAVVLPAIGLVFAIPFFITNYVIPLTGSTLGL